MTDKNDHSFYTAAFRNVHLVLKDVADKGFLLSQGARGPSEESFFVKIKKKIFDIEIIFFLNNEVDSANVGFNLVTCFVKKANDDYTFSFKKFQSTPF